MNAEVLIKFKGDSTDAEKKTKSLETSLGALTKSFTLGNLAAKAITKTMQIFNAGLDSAIARVDTLNNFPRVMSNLGIDAQASSEVIQDLSERLKGLPTTLDAAAMSVQRLTSKNMDVKKSEEIFLAVNNAILAGGASAEIQSAALEQMSQAFAKGKPDMVEWRSLMTAMPAQLTQVAKAMGYVDSATLGEAVRAKGGEKEFSRMIDTMTRMNNEGVNGFKSFEEQARNATGGISTSVTNMKTAFVRGIGNILSSINRSLEPFGGLSGVINNVGKFGEKAFTAIGQALEKIVPILINAANWIKEHKTLVTTLAVAVGTFVATFKTIKKVVAIIKAVKAAFVLLNAVMAANPILIIVAAVAALVAGFIYLWNNCEGFRNFFINMWEGIKKAVGVAVDSIVGFFQNAVSSISTAWNNILIFFSGLWEGIKTIFAAVVEWVNVTIIQPLMAIITPIVDFIKNLSLLIIAVVAMALEGIYNILLGIATWISANVISPIMGLFNSLVQFIVNNITIPIANFFAAAWSTICDGASWLYGIVSGVFNNVKNFICNNIVTPVVNFFRTGFENIWRFVQNVVDKIRNAFNKVKETGQTVFSALRDFVSNLFLTIGNVIKAPINGIINAINGVIRSLNKIKVPDWVPGIGGAGINFSEIPKLNVGTNYVPEDTLAMIHEGEAVVPKKFNPYASTGLNSRTLGAMQGGNSQPIINVYADFEMDPIGQVVSKIKTFSGGAKNDFNYGQGVS